MNKDIGAALTLMGCGFIGIILAAIEYVMYDAGVFIDEFITGSITLPDLMAMTIVIWVLIGTVIAAVKT